MKKHTAAPWTIDWKRGNKRGQIRGGGRTVCSFHSNAPTLTREQDEANARLIATAPELLEALKDCVAWACLATCHGADTGMHTNRCAESRAAIAKAEGRS